ncbi:transposase [Komagataeibacter medellinensis NBRC 3288]|uniref:Transposase n=1 Tax=Komagataeibacter medellinensis (strain NBRC 3288 / BCRC 11682 / LMG 1693 / Kondo 51) TaxID=634177 RepID=G2I6Y4_KOMMN|nr:transposase [Komagataeibacter medellinensis NBRC 3288]
MKERLETTEAGDIYRLRKQTVEPVFGIIKSIMGFRRFSLRGLAEVTTEGTLFARAYNCKRMARLQAA